jgi:hypothetical protein
VLILYISGFEHCCTLSYAVDVTMLYNLTSISICNNAYQLLFGDVFSILQLYLLTMSTTSKADATTHSAARHSHSSHCIIENEEVTQDPDVQLVEDKSSSNGRSICQPTIGTAVCAPQAVLSKPSQSACNMCSMYSGHTTNRSYTTTVIQREGLTVQRHRHTFDGSCYGVTALFHGVTRC